MSHIEKTVASKEVFSGHILKLRVDTVELPNGNPSTREVVEHPGGVAVLALDNDQAVLFVRQYRYPYRQEILELPAGKLNYGEDPAACGLRELEEETGYTAGSYQFLARVYPSPGYADEVLHLYLARALQYRAQKLDPDEFLTVERIPLERALSLCLDGTITDAKTLVALLKYNELCRRGEI